MVEAVYFLTSVKQGNAMINRLACVQLLVFLFSCHMNASGQQIKRFDPKAYPAGTFQVSRHDYPLGNYTVRIIHAKRVQEMLTDPPPSVCRAVCSNPPYCASSTIRTLPPSTRCLIPVHSSCVLYVREASKTERAIARRIIIVQFRSGHLFTC